MPAAGEQEYRDSPVRPFVVTRGRSATGLRVDTLLRSTGNTQPLPVDAPPQLTKLARLLQGGPLLVVEAAAYLGQPVSVVQVLAQDLIATQHL
ncbi:DUF742 domain-containing protein, partial [Actinomadura kijaniata]|uniref:DUF742 domain-containing protein n=1 Tax=Actinomadura kijaniata TaxID=46161 RepID=UPI003F1B02F0